MIVFYYVQIYTTDLRYCILYYMIVSSQYLFTIYYTIIIYIYILDCNILYVYLNCDTRYK